MMDYKRTRLWADSLGTDAKEDAQSVDRLIKAYERARENTAYILSKISKDFPSLTLHDISHVDTLWQVASVITGENYKINPLEGFVLGCSFLMHDAVLSYDAAGGQDQLRDTVEWKDYYADYNNSASMTEDEKLYETDFRTIRHLHAKYAEKLYCQLFTREDDSSFYIVEDELLRRHLGEICGKIAGSHHWDIEDMETLGIQIPPPAGFPADWRVNPLKLACILRCADAGHIDSGRAPDYLLRLLDLNGISRNHWIAQNRLSQIDRDVKDRTKVLIRSEISFKEEDFSAWNIAYDAICILDHEIKSSNETLRKHACQEFQAKGVNGSESQEALSKYILTDGWIPCSARIHISNIEGLIKNLGGEKLYGKDHSLEIAIRELLQNSRDAIVARRKREKGFIGRIDIAIKQEEGKTIINVSDDGVGMSLHTIKDYLLNFGSSFWSSDLAKKEFPGLNASDFKSVGQFGIGFYSVFMVASEVIIETRRYDNGLDNTYLVKFPTGLSLHPIVSKKRSDTASVSTKIQIVLDEKKCVWNNTKKINPGIMGVSSFDVPYSSVIANLVAGLDVDVFYSEPSDNSHLIHTNIEQLNLGTIQALEWLKDITFVRFINDSNQIDYLEKHFSRMRKVIVNGQFHGIAALNTFWETKASFFGVTTVGGLSNYGTGSTNTEFIGFLNTDPQTAKRDGNMNDLDLTEWAHDQYEILCHIGLSDLDKLRLPYVVGKYDIDMTNDMLLRFFIGSRLFVQNLNELLLMMKMTNLKLVLPLSRLSDNNRLENYIDYQRSFDKLQANEILICVEDNSGFLSLSHDAEKYKYNIMNCLQIAAERNSFVLSIIRGKDKAFSHLGGNLDALVISIH